MFKENHCKVSSLFVGLLTLAVLIGQSSALCRDTDCIKRVQDANCRANERLDLRDKTSCTIFGEPGTKYKCCSTQTSTGNRAGSNSYYGYGTGTRRPVSSGSRLGSNSIGGSGGRVGSSILGGTGGRAASSNNGGRTGSSSSSGSSGRSSSSSGGRSSGRGKRGL